jgi:hypothetical protein
MNQQPPLLGSLFLLAMLVVGCGTNNPSETTLVSNQPANSTTLPASQPSLKPSPRPKPVYVRPSTADNGAPFPTESGPIANYPVQFTDGYSKVTVDNSQNGSDVFVKLFSRDRMPEAPIRVFFIRAGESFTEDKVRAGNYDVRYRDLDSGGLSRTESFNLKEIDNGREIQSSDLRLTLYKVPGGNMQTHQIAENEF